MDWSDKGVEGCYRFLQRIWRLATEKLHDIKHLESTYTLVDHGEDCRLLTIKLHKTIKKVTEDIERFHLNTAIASIMELVNAVYKFQEKPRDK